MTQKENHATRPLTWYGACISGCRFTASDAIRSDRIYVYLGQGVSDIQAEPGEPLTRVSPKADATRRVDANSDLARCQGNGHVSNSAHRVC